MSILDEVLQEEYERLTRMKKRMREEMESLPKGYISKKIIRGHEYYYLQHREGKRIVSSYIKKSEITAFEAQIERRRNLNTSLKDINTQMKKIERVIK